MYNKSIYKLLLFVAIMFIAISFILTVYKSIGFLIAIAIGFCILKTIVWIFNNKED